MVKYAISNPLQFYELEWERSQGKNKNTVETPTLCFANAWIIDTTQRSAELISRRIAESHSRANGILAKNKSFDEVQEQMAKKLFLPIGRAKSITDIRDIWESRQKQEIEYLREAGLNSIGFGLVRSPQGWLVDLESRAQKRQTDGKFGVRETIFDVEKTIFILNYAQTLQWTLDELKLRMSEDFTRLTVRNFPQGIPLLISEEVDLPYEAFLAPLASGITFIGISKSIFGIDPQTDPVDGRNMSSWDFYEHDQGHSNNALRGLSQTFVDQDLKIFSQPKINSNMESTLSYLKNLMESGSHSTEFTEQQWTAFLFYAFHEVRISYENSSAFKDFLDEPLVKIVLKTAQGCIQKPAPYANVCHKLDWAGGGGGVLITSVHSPKDTLEIKTGFYIPLDPKFIVRQLDKIIFKNANIPKLKDVDGYRIDYVPSVLRSAGVTQYETILKMRDHLKSFSQQWTP